MRRGTETVLRCRESPCSQRVGMFRDRRWLRTAARDVIAQGLFTLGCTQPARAARGCLTVVTFHRVLPDAALSQYPLPEIAVSVSEFQWFLAFFHKHFSCGSLKWAHDLWVGDMQSPRPLLAITFDDGQLDNFEHARPILNLAKVKASFFVPVDALDRRALLWHDRLAYSVQALASADRNQALSLLAELGSAVVPNDGVFTGAIVRAAKNLSAEHRERFVSKVESMAGTRAWATWDGPMSWDQVRELADEGHEIGSHSMSHSILTLLDDQQLDWELRESKARIEHELSVDCESFCFPNGNCDARVLDALLRAGYRRGVTTEWGVNTKVGEPMRLSRCDMQGQRVRDRAGVLSEARLAFRVSRYFPGIRT